LLVKNYPFHNSRLLIAVTEKYFPNNYFNCGLIGVQADQMCLKDITKSKLTELDEHFRSMDIDLSTITLNWFMSIFFDAVPFEVRFKHVHN
jgi:hypothetical protein